MSLLANYIKALRIRSLCDTKNGEKTKKTMTFFMFQKKKKNINKLHIFVKTPDDKQ